MMTGILKRGKVTGTGTIQQVDDQIIGSGTHFLTELMIGDRVVASPAIDGVVSSIGDDQSAFVDTLASDENFHPFIIFPHAAA